MTLALGADHADAAAPLLDAGPFALRGEWTIHCAAERQPELLALLNGHFNRLDSDPAGERRLRLDATAVSEIDSAGLQLLLAAKRQCAQSGIDLRLQTPSACLRALLQTLRLDDGLQPNAAGPTLSAGARS